MKSDRWEMMKNTKSTNQGSLGSILQTSRLAGWLEIFLLFIVAAMVIGVGLLFVGEDLFARQLVVVAANIAMLLIIWLGLGLRRQSVEYLGLFLGFTGWKSIFVGFAKSLAVLVLALAGFMFGSMIMANITGIPGQADTSGYSYL